MAGACVLLASCNQQPAEAPEGPGAVDIEGQERQAAAAQLAALGGPASADQRALYEGEFTASGSNADLGAGEGVWELRLLNNYAQFVRPGLGEDGGITGARDFREQGMRVTAGALIVTLRAQECPIPNGDPLPYVADVLFEGVAYRGCARRGVAEGERPTWASVIGELMPAIDACLARASARPARVTQASLLGDNQVSVRLREADGGRQVCLATADGASVITFDPLLDTDRLFGEGDPEFVRAPGTAPRAANCLSVAQAQSEAGELLGWVVRRTC
ncbi:MAG: hypothetical protein AB7T08_06465 [Hyphomonadaceae bacterium]